MAVKTHAELQALFANNATKDISEQDLRDFVDSAMLEVSPESADANITGVAGKHYQCTIAGFSASRTLTLPVAAAAGERIRVSILDGSANRELIIQGRSIGAVKINGGNPGTEWSRLFIAGESVLFESTATNNWNVVSDGRIPCAFSGEQATDQTDVPASDWTPATLGTQHLDVGDVFDNVTNSDFRPRRANAWFLMAAISFNGMNGQKRLIVRIEEAAPSVIAEGNTIVGLSSGQAGTLWIDCGMTYGVSVGDIYNVEVYQEDSTARDLNNAKFSGMEILQ